MGKEEFVIFWGKIFLIFPNYYDYLNGKLRHMLHGSESLPTGGGQEEDGKVTTRKRIEKNALQRLNWPFLLVVLFLDGKIVL